MNIEDQETKVMPIIPSETTVPNVDIVEPALSENSPSVTLPQKISAIVAGIPILSNLTAAFGIWTPNDQQLDALEKAGAYSVFLAGILVAGDAGIRFARNQREGKKAIAKASVVAAQHQAAAQVESVAVAQPPMKIQGDNFLDTEDDEPYTEDELDPDAPESQDSLPPAQDWHDTRTES